jgi:hypothetical protein
MPKIEFIYDLDCPNVDGARLALRNALALAGLAEQWQEWNRADASAPEYVRRYGSPSILVNGLDIAGVPQAAAPSCRIYTDSTGHSRGIPPVDTIRRVLESSHGKAGGRGGLFSALPAIGVALLPKLTCAACWPAYAALLGAMGVNFVDYTPWLLPFTATLLGLTLLTLAWRASRRRGLGPFWLGACAALAILTGKFGFESDTAAYSGAAVLLVAAGWNVWPRRHSTALHCPSCQTGNGNPL